MDRNEIPLETHHQGVPLGASKMISKLMVHLAQILHLSCTDTNTVSKWTETRFHMTHVTKEFHQVRTKWFLSLWYVRHKLRTYLVPILALSPNRPNRASTWASSPRYHQVCPKWFLSLWRLWRKPCTCLASRLALSTNGPKRAFTWSSSPRSSIGYVQNDFWACGTFGASRAPILHRHLHCLQTDWIEIPHDPRHLGVQSAASKTTSVPMVHSAQSVPLSCIKISTISK